MFTGIIREIGTLKNAKKTTSGALFSITSGKIRPRPGDSISVNGVCLTVTKKTWRGFTADVIPETLKRTNLSSLQPGAAINLEPSLRYGETVDGHMVNGHVDATAKILRRIQNKKEGTILEITMPAALQRFLVEKGSVAINGVSLTITSTSKKTFSVALTPFTLTHTNLGTLPESTEVNIEADMMMRTEGKNGPRNIQASAAHHSKFSIIVSRWNTDITDRLLEGAQHALQEAGAEYTVQRVPGAFEIPFAAKKIAAEKKRPEAIIALGCLLKGETDHYETVCAGVTYGIQKVAIETGVPVMFGVLMCQKKKQAEKRAIQKGYECAMGALAMARFRNNSTQKLRPGVQ